MRTILAAMTLTLLGVAGCARDRCTCCGTSPYTPPPPSAYKACLIRTTNPTAAPSPAFDYKSPYTAGVTTKPATPTPLPSVKGAWPEIRTPLSTMPRAATITPAPAATVPSGATAVRELEDRPATGATELPSPANLSERSSEPAAHQPNVSEKSADTPAAAPPSPKVPEKSADTAPEALNLGQTPEPEIAPIRQTGATAEPPLAPPPVLAQPTEARKVLTGVVECWRKTWRLRYAGIDVEDVNGGRVTLIGPALDGLREGQRVRVRGILIPTADRGSAPTFDVQAIEVLE